MIRKLFAFLFLLFFAFFALPVYASSVVVNDKFTIYTENNKNVDMVSLKEVSQALGLNVSFNKENGSIVVTDGVVTAFIDANENKYTTSGGVSVNLETNARNMNGEFYIPVSFFEKFFFIRQSKDIKGNIVLEKENIVQPTVLGELSKLENGDWLYLTKEQKLEDFDYLYKILKENYPYIHLVKRMCNINLEEEYQKSRKIIESVESDSKFYAEIENFIRKANMIGHLSVISPFEYDWFAGTYSKYLNSENTLDAYQQRMKKLSSIYSGANSQKSYTGLKNIIFPVYQKVQNYYDFQDKIINQKEENTESTTSTTVENIENTENTTIGNTENTTSATTENTESTTSATVENDFKNVDTKIIKESSIAYIDINSFDMQCYEKDKEILYSFYEQIKNYDNVIFDLTGNGGGSTLYFEDLIAAPNISKELLVNTYGLIEAGEYNMEFFNKDDFEPIANLSALPRMNKDDLQDLDLMTRIEYDIKPLYKEALLKGKLWLLVDGAVFSSSEYAAMFTKATGFATLVGLQTGGDGIGTDPIPIALPNSGIIVRYSAIYGITPDGASSQEFGTIPDIISKDGETPLETCLKMIGNN